MSRFDFVHNFPYRLAEPYSGVDAVGVLCGRLQLLHQIQLAGGNAQKFCFLYLFLRNGNCRYLNFCVQAAGLFLRLFFQTQRQLFRRFFVPTRRGDEQAVCLRFPKVALVGDAVQGHSDGIVDGLVGQTDVL